ncbi:hypothetical protein FH972_024280 [Carpinus fangiana]|uniref:DUF7730 domain-containing protein n=1 Tax=Carpinus fangiana TaxID=176857 RepID=A0A5N6KXL5_9ROSI|nr:hypothetical protein FH972_024280 [Carpinus fangiana]
MAKSIEDPHWVFMACAIICFPITCVLFTVSSIRERRTRKSGPRESFTEHCANREVASTLQQTWLKCPDVSCQRSQVRALEQTQSTLLSRLSLEIRNEIYELVLGGQSIILQIANDEFTIPGEYSAQPSLPMGMQTGQTSEADTRIPPARLRLAACFLSPERSRLLSLPMACRRTYTETMSLIYRKNSFQLFEQSFPRGAVLVGLPTALPSYGFNTITSLLINWILDDDFFFCESCMFLYKTRWKTLNAMDGLRDLVIMFRANLDTPIQQEEQGLGLMREGILSMRVLHKFEVTFIGGVAWMDPRIQPLIESRTVQLRS